MICLFVCFWHSSSHWARASPFTWFLEHTQWHTTVSKTPLDEWSAHHRDLYLTTHITHNRQNSTWQHTALTIDRPQPDNTQHSQ
jgi:hypothetical protein